ncbi:hypothetical protein J3D45_000125 [Microbacterium foliorum]|uniref:hypothetical protein n=1 Tax=Microbacterium foliorum TaxID=104336 RepID=UPI00209F653E|nr:hypothetical protein [Microbacterium foliorum]MCP1427627.1 hypothetical protein [Microbacterium foliorum]
MLTTWLRRRAVPVAAVGGSLLLLSLWLVPGDVAESQNRAEVEFPAVSPQALTEAETFAHVDRALRDRLGAQVPVVHVAGAVSNDVGMSPNSTTWLGEGREPFFAVDFIYPCRGNPARIDAVHQQLQDDTAAVQGNGAYIVYTVAPDKSSIRDEELGVLRDSLLNCSDRVRSAFAGWGEAQDFPLITLWDRLEHADSSRQGRDDGAYYFGDSHWNADGAAVWTRALLERLVDDGVVSSSVLSDLDETSTAPGEVVIPDLFRNMGLTETVERVEKLYDRPAVTTTTDTVVNSAGTTLTHKSSTSAEAELVPGKTLILGDSFLRTHAATQLAPFFADVTFGSLADYEDVADYDNVIVERVQRNAVEPGWPDFAGVIG